MSFIALGMQRHFSWIKGKNVCCTNHNSLEGRAAARVKKLFLIREEFLIGQINVNDYKELKYQDDTDR